MKGISNCIEHVCVLRNDWQLSKQLKKYIAVYMNPQVKYKTKGKINAYRERKIDILSLILPKIYRLSIMLNRVDIYALVLYET